MTDAIAAFFDAWGETEAAPRRAAIATAMAEGFTYIDPRAPDAITDLDGLSDYVGMFSANAPGWTAKVVKDDEKLGYVRATVAFGGMGPDGKEMVQHGQYFAQMTEGKIATLVGFVGTGAPE